MTSLVLLALWHPSGGTNVRVPSTGATELTKATSRLPVDLLQREQEAEQAHLQTFEKWCRAETAAQSGRRKELQRLHDQSVPPERDAVLLDTLTRRSKELAIKLERRRAEASQVDARRAHAKVALESLEKQVAALTSTKEELERGAAAGGHAPAEGASAAGGGEASHGGGLHVVSELLKRAQAQKEKADAEVRNAPTALEQEVKQLDAEYQAKSQELMSLRTRRKSAQAGQHLLSAALQDQDKFLADLQSICDLGRRVYKRFDKDVRPILKTVVQNLTLCAEEPPRPPPRQLSAQDIGAAMGAAAAIVARPSVTAPPLAGYQAVPQQAPDRKSVV